MNYWISEEQLNRLAVLNPEWPDQVEEREQLVDVVRTQILDQDSGD